MSTHLPEAGLVAWWTTSWLRGHVVADQVLDAVRDMGVDGGWLDLLSQLRRSGATGAGIALPVEGDPLGLGGPPSFNAAVLEAGSAVIVASAGLGLVADEVDGSTWWRRAEAASRSVPDIGEADRALRLALTTTATALADLDVARWRPEAADELMNLRRPALAPPPPGIPPVCAQLAATGARAARIVDLALADEGGSVSAYEIEARRGALRPLELAARRALVAACSPEAWPPESWPPEPRSTSEGQ